MKRWTNWITGFLPPQAFAQEETFRSHRLFVASSFLTALFALGYCLMSIYLHGYLFAWAMVGSMVAFLLLPYGFKLGLSQGTLTHAFVSIIAVVYVLLVYWEGGIRYANVTPWIILLPASAMMISGKKAAVLWLIVALIIVVVMASFTFRGIKFPIRFDTSKDPLFNLLSLSGLLCIVSFIIFISETGKRKALLKLAAQNQSLERLNEEKNNFLGIVAHDLKNPLAIVRAFATLSSKPSTTVDERTMYLQYISSSADKMFELIKNLLDVNMIEAGRLVLKYESFSVTELLKAYIMLNEPVALARQIKLTSKFPEGPVIVKTDRARLEQILDNYTGNAMKYSPDDTSVYLQVIEDTSYVEISIVDEGPGIDKDEQQKLFKQFSVTSSVPREGEHSMGLGLATVKKIADALNAEVGCRSEKGQGSTFFIRLPKRD